MTALDDRLVPRVKALIERFGKLLTFTIEETSFDAAAGATVVNDRRLESVRCSPPAQFMIEAAGGTAKLSESLETYLPAQGLSFEPKVGMVVSFDGRDRKVLGVGKVYTGEAIAVFRLEVSS